MRLLLLLVPATLSLATACGGINNPFPSSAHHDADLAVGTQTKPSQAAEDCAAETVRHLTLAVDPAAAGGGTFAYAYEYHPPTDAAAPTVVYVPGGPGQTAIGGSADWLAKLPPGYGLILTDPRGVGCNANPADQNGEFPAAFYRSDLVAGDILAAVGDAGVTDWLIFGISYGTAVATVAASKAEAGAKVPAPKAVVLEGTLGRAESVDDANGTYVKLWDAELARQPLARAAFTASALPLDYSAASWQQVIQLGIMIGNINTAGTALASQGGTVNFLDLLVGDALSSDATRTDWAKKTIDKIVAAPPLDPSIKGTEAFYVYIACQELWANPSGLVLRSGELVPPSTTSVCDTVHLSLGANAFDAGKWPVKAPIYYLQGADDPATPVVVARYHFDAEKTSPSRQMALVTGGGHNPFELSLSACYQETWRAMAAGSGFAAAISGCKWPLGVTLVTDQAGVSSERSLP